MIENNTDTKAELILDLTDEEFLKIARLAHENDITINQQIERLLQLVIDKYERVDHNSSEFSTDALHQINESLRQAT